MAISVAIRKLFNAVQALIYMGLIAGVVYINFRFPSWREPSWVWIALFSILIIYRNAVLFLENSKMLKENNSLKYSLFNLFNQQQAAKKKKEEEDARPQEKEGKSEAGREAGQTAEAEPAREEKETS